MASYSEILIMSCARDARALYAGSAEERLRRQISWSRARGAHDETAFWTAVLERLSAGNDAAPRLRTHPAPSDRYGIDRPSPAATRTR
ncbi:hypothetical protein [Sphingopyxis chilensis]|uniref:hypothetical protein n=1 Tax=Sphingopyxis chilensis TaxID=180400 RepID=UPI002DDD5D37|nr:hypothetical protein [Sphingopyxis chilensis]